MNSSQYIANLQRTGLLYEEYLILLKKFWRTRSWEAVEKMVWEENLLKKHSESWISDILRSFKHRFLAEVGALPPVECLAFYISQDIPRQSKIQVLYQYICNADRLVDRLIRGYLLPRLIEVESFYLIKELFNNFLASEGKSHPELMSWSEEVKAKWGRSFYRLLRVAGIMENAPSILIRKPIVRLEAFTFLFYGLLDKGLSITECLKNVIWERFFYSGSGIEELLGIAQQRGWLSYKKSGRFVDLESAYESLEEWINDSLG